jgi:hypothetical protein
MLFFNISQKILKALMKYLLVLLQLWVSNTANTTFYDWLGHRPPWGKADSNLRQNLLFLGPVDIMKV